jgi:outer membrane lipoprotein-sorting protein
MLTARKDHFKAWYLMRRSAYLSVFCTAVIACLLWAASARAYIFPGAFILELVSRNFAGVQSMKVEQKVVIDDSAMEASPVELDETIQFLIPGRFRSEIVRPEGHLIRVVSDGADLTILDDRIVQGGGGRLEGYKDLLLYRSRHMMHKILLSRGVDVGIVSLGRMGDRLVYVIGAQYPDETVSQVWIDKERLLPLRWIDVAPGTGGGGPGERMDFVYREWASIDGTWYPMQIESFVDQRRQRVIHAVKVEANVDIPGESMNIEYLRSRYAPSGYLPLDGGAEPDALEEVEQTIKDFKSKFEE